MARDKSRICLLLLVLALTACSSRGQPPPPQIAYPAQFVAQFEGDMPLTNWVAAFDSEELNALLHQVLQHNFALKETEARLSAAAAQAELAGARLYPTVDFALSASRTENLHPGRSDSLTRFPGVSQYGAFFNVRWEADVWGRLSAAEKAASYDYEAALSDYRASRHSLIAQTVKSWLLFIEGGRQRQLASDFLQNMKKAVEVSDAFYQAGEVSLVALAHARTEAARAAQRLVEIQRAQRSAGRALQLLSGRYPDAGLQTSGEFPALPDWPAAGLPAELLERRPDIRAAERRVAAAFNRLEQSRAAKLPALQLSASLGGSSTALKTLIEPQNVLWTVATNLLFPLFNGGEREAEIKMRNAEQRAALAAYRQTALAAFNEVETGLDDNQLLRERQRQLIQARTQSELAEKIALEKFRLSEIELLELLQTVRETLSVRMDEVRARRELLSQQVDLYLALGGEPYGLADDEVVADKTPPEVVVE